MDVLIREFFVNLVIYSFLVYLFYTIKPITNNSKNDKDLWKVSYLTFGPNRNTGLESRERGSYGAYPPRELREEGQLS